MIVNHNIIFKLLVQGIGGNMKLVTAIEKKLFVEVRTLKDQICDVFQSSVVFIFLP